MNNNNIGAPKQAANLLKTRTSDHPRNQSRSQLAAASTPRNQLRSSSRSTSRNRSYSQTRVRLNHSDEHNDLRSSQEPTVHSSRSLDEVSDGQVRQSKHRHGHHLNNSRQPGTAVGLNNQSYTSPPADQARNGACGHNGVEGRMTAEQGEDNIQDLLTCTVCFELYDDDEHQPKLLSCHHSLCKQCILTLISASSSRHSTSVSKGQRVTCPTCRNTTALPSATSHTAAVARMQTNFYVAQMKDLIGCAVRPRGAHGPQSCPRHEKEILELFCRSCAMSICQKCRANDHSQMNGRLCRPMSSDFCLSTR